MRNTCNTSEPCSKACRSTVSDVMLYVLPPSCPPATNPQAMHQDVWSRYCGGVSACSQPTSGSHQSGAPGWTLARAGFDLSDDGDKLIKSGAALLDGIRGGRLEGERGLWPTGLFLWDHKGYALMEGYQKLAAASMK